MNSVLLASAVVASAILGLVALMQAPRLALAGWLAVVCAVPVWAGLTVVVDLEPHVLASVGLLACLLPAVVAGRSRVAGRLTWADGVLAVFLAAALVGVVAGRVTITDTFVLVVQWSAAFLAGRLIGHRVPLRWVFGAMAVAASLVAVLALVEFLTTWNPFVQVPGSGGLYDDWSPIQERGGRSRAEGAFGHSIALGACLALAVPLTLAAPFSARVRLTMTTLLVAASAVTFSRIGLLTAVGGVALSVLFLRSDLSARLRWTVVGGLVVVVTILSSLLQRVFDAAGAEATDSATYRLDLLTLMPSLQPFGLADSLYRSPSGQLSFGAFRSVDNALLLLGLAYGWVPLVLVVLLLCTSLWCLVSGRATAPAIAVVAQIPAFVTVALITQYSTLLWFVVGLAVFAQSVVGGLDRDGDGPPEPAAPDSAPSQSPVSLTRNGVRRGGEPFLALP